jgi:hypothetical protein
VTQGLARRPPSFSKLVCDPRDPVLRRPRNPVLRGHGNRDAIGSTADIETTLPPITVDFRDVAVEAGLTTLNVNGGKDRKKSVFMAGRKVSGEIQTGSSFRSQDDSRMHLAWAGTRLISESM